MKKNGIDIDECDYKEMTHAIGGQSQPSEYWEEPLRNSYENDRKSFYGANGFDWSGMRRAK